MSEEPSPARSHRSLVADMRLALLSEIGARSAYDHLRGRVRDGDLEGLLARLNQEGAENVERLSALIRELGGLPPRTSLRRRILARLLAASTPIVGLRIVLRVCLNAEETVARWYGEYAHFLAALGQTTRARTCEQLRQVKLAHASALSAWITHMKP